MSLTYKIGGSKFYTLGGHVLPVRPPDLHMGDFSQMVIPPVRHPYVALDYLSDAPKGGRNPKVRLPLLHKGDLSVFGYHDISHLSPEQRHEALMFALDHIPPLELYHKLNALYVLHKNQYDANFFKNDRDFVRQFLHTLG